MKLMLIVALILNLVISGCELPQQVFRQAEAALQDAGSLFCAVF